MSKTELEHATEDRRPRFYTVHFSRSCPHGIWLSARGGDRRPIKGTIRLLDYNEEAARRSAAFMLDRVCVIDRVIEERAVQPDAKPDGRAREPDEFDAYHDAAARQEGA